MLWLDRLGFYGLPVAATLLLHLSVVAFLTLRWPETRTVIASAPKLQVIQASLVDSAALKPKKTTSAPPAKPQTRPKTKKAAKPKPVVKTPTPQPAPAAASRPVPEPEPVSTPESSRPELTAEELAALTRAEMAAAIAAEASAVASPGSGNLRDTVAALIQRAVINRWTRPPSARNGMVAVLAIQLVPTGEVVGVSVLESSGNSAFDRSAMTAVERAGRFPEVTQLERDTFEKDFRRFQLIFRPEDLRY